MFCLGHDFRWKRRGRPDAEESIASCENPGPGQEHIDLRQLPAGLRLEMRYVLQQFVSKFRASQQYTPEYGASCTGGVGTPLQR